MHKNTFTLVIFLGIFAAIVAGVNFARYLSPDEPVDQTNIAIPSITPTAIPERPPGTFTNNNCGFSIDYPAGFESLSDATAGAVLINKKTNESVIMACQKDIPRPALTPDRIEKISVLRSDGISTLSARLYHDQSEQDGSPMDEVIFTHPVTKLDIYIAGNSAAFTSMISTITVLP